MPLTYPHLRGIPCVCSAAAAEEDQGGYKRLASWPHIVCLGLMASWNAGEDARMAIFTVGGGLDSIRD